MEYGMIVTHVELEPEIDKMDGKIVAQSLTMNLQKIVQKTSKAVDNLNGGGWHIISHEITRIGKNLVLSFLISR